MLVDDPLAPQSEQPKECESCQHPLKVLKFYQVSRVSRGRFEAGGYWLCELCATTMTSNALEYPEQYYDGKNGEIMRTVCFVGNAVIAAGRTPVQETLLRLLSDAKRMAEFGDINEDMDDDGVGWKAWYKEVSAVLKEAGQ